MCVFDYVLRNEQRGWGTKSCPRGGACGGTRLGTECCCWAAAGGAAAVVGGKPAALAAAPAAGAWRGYGVVWHRARGRGGHDAPRADECGRGRGKKGAKGGRDVGMRSERDEARAHASAQRASGPAAAAAAALHSRTRLPLSPSTGGRRASRQRAKEMDGRGVTKVIAWKERGAPAAPRNRRWEGGV